MPVVKKNASISIPVFVCHTITFVRVHPNRLIRYIYFVRKNERNSNGKPISSTNHYSTNNGDNKTKLETTK